MSIWDSSYTTEEIQQVNLFTPHLHHKHFEKPIVDISEQFTPQYLQAIISEWENSDNRRYMDVAEQYYHSNNDILKAKRMVIGRNSENEPSVFESKVLSNNHLVHNYLRKLTHQKISYLLSKAFSFQPDTDSIDRGKAFFTALSPYYNLPLFNTIKLAARDSIVDGIGWIYVYYDEQGELCFKHIPATEVIPIWEDIDHKDLRAAVRKYTVKEFDGKGFVNTTYVEAYTQAGVIKYKKADKSKTNDGTDLVLVEGLTPYFNIQTQEGEISAAWTDIPFIPFKYDDDEYSLLRRIKTLIDDYDQKTTDVANAIDDIPNSITVIKNYDGASKEEFVHNKNQYRTIFVQGDGDARALETPLNIDEIDTHLKRLREDIYSFGQGVNTGDKDIRDTSGVALRFLYGDLDMDCSDWGEELQWSIYLLNWFISRDILMKTGEDYSDVNYTVVFNVSVILNQSEVINNVLQSKGIVSDKTLLANHPWVIDVDNELEQIEEDTERAMEQSLAQMEQVAQIEGQYDNSSNSNSSNSTEGSGDE